MTCNPKTITPDTSLQEIESLMVTYDLGRLPVLENGQLVGITIYSLLGINLSLCNSFLLYVIVPAYYIHHFK